MTPRDSIGVYDAAEFADNPEPRCSIVLVVDVSPSMKGAPIETVNQALVKFRDIIREDSVTALRADVAVVAFGARAEVVQDFTSGIDLNPPVLTHKIGTRFSPAVNLALDIIEARKQSYRDGGIAYYRSLAYFLTDGEGSDKREELERTATRLVEAEENRSVAFFPFCIGSDGTSMLAKLFPRTTVELIDMEQLDGSIQWLSRSVTAVSQSQPGQGIRLPEQNFRNS